MTAEERREAALRLRVEVAQAMVDAGRAEAVMVQDSQVYVARGTCAGCSGVGDWLVDKTDAWCPRCGGRALVHLEATELAEFENGLCRLGTSAVIHLVAPPFGQNPVCFRNVRVGRMRPARDADEPTCQRCIAERDGQAAYGHGAPAAPKRRAGTR